MTEQTNSAVEAVAMPLEFTERMQTVWQNAFSAQLRKRHKQRFDPQARPISAEEAAWGALVKHCAVMPAAVDARDKQVAELVEALERVSKHVSLGLQIEALITRARQSGLTEPPAS